MTTLDNKEARAIISKVFRYIDNGVVTWNNDTFLGHPDLFFFHSKKELLNKMDSLLHQEKYDRYDLYYIINSLIKYMLGKYDSHTKAIFQDSIIMPIKFKIQNDKVYIINHSKNIEDCKGATIVSINDIKIEKILDELEKIISYSTIEYLHTMQEVDLQNFDILMSLPSINNNIDTMTFKILHHNELKNISFNKYHLPTPYHENIPQNYSYEILNNVIVIHYNSCKSTINQEMLNLISKLKLIESERKVNNYIVDLRNNGGGDSRIIIPLIEYLKGKDIVVLVNEKVFSSGRMAYVELKKIGAYSIGTDISTSLNCFGNVPGELKLDNLSLIIKRSSTYWYYDKYFKCTGYRKDSFTKYFRTRKDLLEPIILHPDEYVYMSVDNILNGNDSQMMAAINYFRKKENNNEYRICRK